jgi:hypothetical protein
MIPPRDHIRRSVGRTLCDGNSGAYNHIDCYCDYFMNTTRRPANALYTYGVTRSGHSQLPSNWSVQEGKKRIVITICPLGILSIKHEAILDQRTEENWKRRMRIGRTLVHTDDAPAQIDEIAAV